MAFPDTNDPDASTPPSARPMDTEKGRKEVTSATSAVPVRGNNQNEPPPPVVSAGSVGGGSTKSVFQSRLAHFQQLAFNTPSSTSGRDFVPTPRPVRTEPRNDAPAPRELAPEPVALRRMLNSTLLPPPRDYALLEPVPRALEQRLKAGNDFQARLAHFRELANHNTGFVPASDTTSRSASRSSYTASLQSPVHWRQPSYGGGYNASSAGDSMHFPREEAMSPILASPVDPQPSSPIQPARIPSISQPAAAGDDLPADNFDAESTDSLLTLTVVGVASRLGDDDARDGESSPPLKISAVDHKVYPPTLITPAIKSSRLRPHPVFERSRSTPIPAVIKTSRIPARPSGTISTEPQSQPQPRTRVPGRTGTKPRRRTARTRHTPREMRVVLMLMHERAGSSMIARAEELDLACAVAAEAAMTPLKFVEFALCRPEDRRHDVTAQPGLDAEMIIRGIEAAFRPQKLGIQDVFVQRGNFCVVLRTTTTKFKLRTPEDMLPRPPPPPPQEVDASEFLYWGMCACDHVVAGLLRELESESEPEEPAAVYAPGSGTSGANFLLRRDGIVGWLETGGFT